MEAYIISAVRTAVGRFGGSLASFEVPELGAMVLKEALKRASLTGGDVGEVIMGNVIQAGLGQNPARQASVMAGFPERVPSFTVNKVCGSGLKSVALAGQAVALGDPDVIVAGGMESMTNAPYVSKTMRWGQRLGNAEMVDTLMHDALWDSFYDVHMGITAENIAAKYNISREEQDAFAATSQTKTEQAIKEGRFRDEIVPVKVKSGKEEKIFDTDEHPRFGTTVDSLARLKPAFKAEGTITAGNASGINDGSGAVVVVSKKKLDELKPPWAFKITAYQAAALDPAFMGLGPIYACRDLLGKAGCGVDDLDLIEVNEAFAAQSLQVTREMKWDPERVNVLGGAIAIGHPVGASGTRILVTLIYEMLHRDAKRGLASLCIGGGQGIAMIIERAR